MILEEMLVTQIRTNFSAYWLGCFFGRLLTGKEAITEKKTLLYREIASKSDIKELLKNKLFEVPLRMFCIQTVDDGKRVVDALHEIIFSGVFSISQIDSIRFHLYDLVIRDGLKFTVEEVDNYERLGNSTQELLKARAILLGIPGGEKRSGTQTWLVSCPDCKTKKRCDKNTKRYKCKCGFDSPFPLPS